MVLGRTVMMLGVLSASLAILEQTSVVHAGRRVMSSPRVRADVLDGGSLGDSLRKLNLVETVPPGEAWRFGTKSRGAHIELVYGAKPIAIDAVELMPTLAKPAPDELTVSLSIHARDLTDPRLGMLPNPDIKLEKPASLALFRGEELLFQTRCGVGLSGHPQRFQRGWASFRLYLREEYGVEQLPAGVIRDTLAEYTDRLNVRAASITSSNLGFEVANRIGALAPGMERCRLVLNGEDQGLMSLTEHLSRRTISRRLGHDDYDFYRSRADATVRDRREAKAMRRWVNRLGPDDFNTAKVGQVIDLDNLARHLFGIMWCGVDDWAQGARLRDRRADHPLWTWVHWDMDRGFQHSYSKQPCLVWQKAGLDLVLGVREVEQKGDRPQTFHSQQTSLRAIVFKGMLANDQEFRDLFLSIAARSMNHLLTREWMEPLIVELGSGLEAVELRDATGAARAYMGQRSKWMMKDICDLMGLGAPVWIRLRGPQGVELTVDGYPVGPKYSGWYFPGQTITVASPEPIVWISDGVKSKGTEVSVEANQDLVIFARP